MQHTLIISIGKPACGEGRLFWNLRRFRLLRVPEIKGAPAKAEEEPAKTE